MVPCILFRYLSDSIRMQTTYHMCLFPVSRGVLMMRRRFWYDGSRQSVLYKRWDAYMGGLSMFIPTYFMFIHGNMLSIFDLSYPMMLARHGHAATPHLVTYYIINIWPPTSNHFCWNGKGVVWWPGWGKTWSILLSGNIARGYDF